MFLAGLLLFVGLEVLVAPTIISVNVGIVARVASPFFTAIVIIVLVCVLTSLLLSLLLCVLLLLLRYVLLFVSLV